MAAGALCPIGGSITLSNCFKICGSSIAIKLVVCLLKNMYIYVNIILLAYAHFINVLRDNL